MLADLRYRLRALFDRSALDRELDEELRFHIDREVEKYVAQGMSRDDAERQARLAFGGLDQVKEDARDVRGVALGLGIGANTAMFGIVDRLTLGPPCAARYLVVAGIGMNPLLRSCVVHCDSLLRRELEEYQ